MNGFDLDHLPYAVAELPTGGTGLVTRLGDRALELGSLVEAVPELGEATLDALLAAGPATWASAREAVRAAAAGGTLPAHEVDSLTLRLAFTVADYVDFYASEHHATNVGRVLRPDAEPLPPNYKHLPIGYHGRAGTVLVSGSDVRRPSGQRLPAGSSGGVPQPELGPSRRLDLEAELGFVVGAGSPLGSPVPVADFADHVFGVVGLNDWSARDLQAWEYVPLGPFLGKSFATSVSAWVTPLAALDAAWCPLPGQDPRPLPYLAPEVARGLDLDVEIELDGHVVSRPAYREMYWSPEQMLAHLTSNGASLRPGDLFGSGTISGPEPGQRGCLLELSWGGREPFGTEHWEGGRTFLEDGDEVVLRYSAAEHGRRAGHARRGARPGAAGGLTGRTWAQPPPRVYLDATGNRPGSLLWTVAVRPTTPLSLLAAGALTLAITALPTGGAGFAAGPTCQGQRATIVGTDRSDDLTGTSGRDVIVGLGGDDRIDGAGGRDLVCGDDGDDVLAGGDGPDSVYGGAGEDRISGDAGDDYLHGEDGADRLEGGDGDDYAGGDDGDDVLLGGDGDDYLGGGQDDDSLSGDAGDDRVVGDQGKDSVSGGEGGDALSGGDGDDKVAGGADDDELSGGLGDDELLGNSGDDVMQGDNYRTSEEDPDGDDTLDGGPGVDEVQVFKDSDQAGNVRIDLGAGTARGQGSDTLTDVESASAFSPHDDVLIGSAADNTFYSGDGNDLEQGLGGDDTFLGAAGDDVIEGGDGSDTDDLSNQRTRVTVNLLSDLATGRRLGRDTLDSVENVTGGPKADTLTGDGAANTLLGGLGRDTLRGGAGDDVLRGGGNNAQFTDRVDRLSGGPGDDVLDGDDLPTGDKLVDAAAAAGHDQIDFSSAESPVVVDLAAGTATGEGNDTLLHIDDVVGSPQDDVLVGNDLANELNGAAGDDVVQGAGGDDEIEGSAGDDTMDGGEGRDLITFTFAGDPVTLDLAAGTATGQGTDTVTGMEDVVGSLFSDDLTGDDGPNVIDAALGADTVNGLGGSDTLIGERGDDTLDGGDDADDIDPGLGDDSVAGGPGADHVVASPGADALDGGDGVDTVDYSLADASVEIDLAAGTARSTQDDTVTTFENVIGSDFDDQVLGDDQANDLDGRLGVDTISGRGGDDLLTGGAMRNRDFVSGGPGIDTVSYAPSGHWVVVDLAGGFSEGAGQDVLVGLENVIGSRESDDLRGDNGPNTIDGGVGDDQIELRGGDDHAIGGLGTDFASGGSGIDLCETEFSSGCE